MAATAATSDVSDGPVLSVFNKRLRALRKKLNRITQMEESIAQGKQLNKEQEEVLRSKPSVTVAIDELEKLRQPLTAAVAEEIDLATKRRPPPVSEKEGDSEEAKKDKVGDEVEKSGAETLALEDLLSLIYFAHMFDVKSLQSDFNSIIVTRTHERECCLSYDYVGDDDANVMLGETDLDLISMMGKLLISRPVDSSSSHENALRRCIEHAKLWLEKSEQPIDVNSGVTYLSLREKLTKIMRSEYVKIVPEMKPTTDIAASAAGNYVSLKVPPATAEGSVQYEQKDEGVADFQTSETSENQSSPGEEPHKDYSQAENPAEFQIQSEPGEQHVAGGGEFREPQRRSYYNQRSGGRNGGGGGGRRGGYSNGRGGRGGGRGGGGPYQNGRNQYYDQPGNYYQGNNYYHNNNRGRVNRGASGNGGNAYNHASGVPVADS